jgi:hypothetical protein
MKKILVPIVIVLAACFAHGQGTLVFDQQVNPTAPPSGFFNIVPDPSGESFIPTLSSVGFVQFYFSDGANNGVGSTISVNLWSGSLGAGTILGTTTVVSMPDLFTGQSTFFFTAPVSVIPGTTYYLQPVIQSGDSFQAGVVPGSDYPNGISYLNGTPQPGGDFWFREGIVAVPEPSSFSLVVVGLIGIYPVLRNRGKSKSVPKTHKIHSKEPCSEKQPSSHYCAF